MNMKTFGGIVMISIKYEYKTAILKVNMPKIAKNRVFWPKKWPF